MFKSEKNRANCTAIADSLGELDSQSLNHLLCNSPWDYKSVLDKITCETSSLFEDKDDVALLNDEVGFRKKGKYSACVGRQYLGCIGKHDNGQVAVVGGLSAGNNYCPISVDLFMPKSWELDFDRRRKVGIPKNIQHQSKPDMALDIIRNLHSKDVSFNHVGFDALYGNSGKLIGGLDKDGIQFIGDIRKNIQVFLKEPVYSIPAPKTARKGRKPKNSKPDQQEISVSKYLATLTANDFEEISFRDETKQKICAMFHKKKVWVRISDVTNETILLNLLIRKDFDDIVKFSLCNMHDLPLVKLAQRQGQRVFIERVFEEGKNQIGMGDYQVRSWEGFHKHMTLCFLAFFLCSKTKIRT